MGTRKREVMKFVKANNLGGNEGMERGAFVWYDLLVK